MVNESKGMVVAEQARVANTFWSRFWGLMGRRGLGDGEALLLKSTASIHTMFMRFPIDAVFVDKEARVVKVVRGLKPFRFALGGRGARGVLELAAGAAARAQVERGDRLVMEEVEGNPVRAEGGG